MVHIQAARNAVIQPWSNGQTEDQINRLKTLKHAIFGRAHAELLRARLVCQTIPRDLPDPEDSLSNCFRADLNETETANPMTFARCANR